MKKILIITALVLMVTAGLSAVDLGIGLFFNYAEAEQAEYKSDFDNIVENAFLTFHIDVPLESNIGLLMSAGVRFESIDDPEDPTSMGSDVIHWNGQFGPVFHLFGYKSRFFDPYGSVGIGCAGSVLINHDLNSYYHDDDIYWLQNTSIEIYTYASAGLNLVLSRRLLVGAELQAKFYSFNPTPLADYELFDYAMRISFGIRL